MSSRDPLTLSGVASSAAQPSLHSIWREHLIKREKGKGRRPRRKYGIQSQAPSFVNSLPFVSPGESTSEDAFTQRDNVSFPLPQISNKDGGIIVAKASSNDALEKTLEGPAASDETSLCSSD